MAEPMHTTALPRPTSVPKRLGSAESGAWTIAGLVAVLWGLRLWGYGTLIPMTVVPSVVLTAWGLFLIGAAWMPGFLTGSRGRWVLAITVSLTILSLALWSYTQVFTVPAYGTDEMAFDQYAAQLALHGIDPYLRSMAPAFAKFQVSPNGYTFELNGTPVTALSYPALSFLLYVPFLALGWSTQLAVALNVGAWAVSLVLLAIYLPARQRPLAVALTSFSVYIGYAVGGVTDALYVPFLIIAAVGWDRYGSTRGWAAWIGPLAFGCAMDIKQTAWMLLPFLLMGLIAEAHRKEHRGWPRLQAAARYTAIAALAFFLPNLPYLVPHPVAWVNGIFKPLLASTVPSGQGWITLDLFLHGGGSITAVTMLSLVAVLALGVLYAVTYPRLKGWTFFAPSLILFWATRSFGSYLVMLIPAAWVAWTTMGRSNPIPRLMRKQRALVATALGAVGVALAVAMTEPSPLTVQIAGVHTTGQLATVDRVTIVVHNTTAQPLRPAFTADNGGTLTAFWNRLDGPAVLAAHHQATYTLAAPNFYAQPPLTGGFQVVAFTSTPKTLSHSAAYLPTTWHLAMLPDAVNHPVPIQQVVTLQVRILNRLDQPVPVGSVPVYLGQIIYAQRGLEYGQAQINHGYPGETPVTALTNARGIATFVIRDTTAPSDPVYFEANLVNDTYFYPYGYSQIVPVRFVR